MVWSSIGRWFESGSKDFFLHENSEEAGVLSASVLELIVICNCTCGMSCCKKGKSFEPDSNQRPMDDHTTTVHRSTN